MIRLDFENVSSAEAVPDPDRFRLWAEAAAGGEDVEISIRIVDEPESAELNQTYRRKSGPTNVLSFPFEVPPGIPNKLLGDLVICAGIVVREALEQRKDPEAHWAHMVVHGMLHLRGRDHVDDAEAEVMEAEEIAILAEIGFQNPYEEETSPS